MTSIASSLPGLNTQLPQKDVDGSKIAQNTKDVHQAAIKFESLFMNEMLSHMFEGVNAEDENNPMGSGHGGQVFQSMLTEQYGKLVAESGQTGLSKQIEKEMLKMQEQQSNPRQKTGFGSGMNNATA